MAEARILRNVHQVYKYLREEAGFQVSYGKVRDAISRRELPQRRGGGWVEQTVVQWARAALAPTVDESARLDAPQGGSSLLGEQKIARQVSLMQLKESRERFSLAKDRGRYIETPVVERELAERWTAVKLLLRSWIQESGPDVAALFGGDAERAQELVALVEGNADKADELSRRQFAVLPELVASFERRLAEVLNNLSSGNWFTEEMASAWAQYQQSVEDEELETARELIALVGGNQDAASKLLGRFWIAPREVRQ